MKKSITVLLVALTRLTVYCAHAQSGDDIVMRASDADSTRSGYYRFENCVYRYSKPKAFQFVLNLPKAFVYGAGKTFNQKSLPALTAIAASTLLLIPADQYIADHAQQFGRYIHLDSRREYKTLVSFKLGKKIVPVYEAPQNLNSAFYSVGEGFTSVAISAGMFAYGKIKKDYRSLQTASQIIQAQLMVGLVSQSIKRISGRESPFRATRPGGTWRPLPGFSTYLNNTSRYDAFPSGHLASMMATVTVLTSNYPEKKWLPATAYGLMTIVSFAMINNGVHWAGDYPLALGIGYICGKATVNLNRLVQCDKKISGRKNWP